MNWSARVAMVAAGAMILTVAACGGSAAPPAPPAPLKFLTSPAALVHAGQDTDFPVRASDRGAQISESGTLPPGLSFRPGPGGTAAIAGVPGGDAGGSYQVRLTASDGTRSASQELAISVDELPYFPSLDTTVFGANEYHGNQIVIVATGYPMPQLSYTGTLPGGFTFTRSGTGMVTISGSPGSFEGPCSSSITINATSSAGSTRLPLTIKIGDWRCALNVAAPLLGHLITQAGGVIVGKVGKPVGEWLWQNGKKAAAWVWERGRAVVVPVAEGAAQGAEDASEA